MHRRDVLASLGAVALGAAGDAMAEAAPESSGLKGVPALTAAELDAALRKEGFQWRFIGRQIRFTATVVAAGATPRVRIEGMGSRLLNTAVLHHAPVDHHLKAGDRVQVRGLIVDQWYGVWQVWQYQLSLVDA